MNWSSSTRPNLLTVMQHLSVTDEECHVLHIRTRPCALLSVERRFSKIFLLPLASSSSSSSLYFTPATCDSLFALSKKHRFAFIHIEGHLPPPADIRLTKSKYPVVSHIALHTSPSDTIPYAPQRLTSESVSGTFSRPCWLFAHK